MKSITFLFLLFLSFGLLAQADYEIIKYNPENASIDGYIFSAIELESSSTYLSTRNEKTIRDQYGFEKEQVLCLTGAKGRFHILVADEQPVSSNIFSKIKKKNSNAFKVDILKAGSKAKANEKISLLNSASTMTAKGVTEVAVASSKSLITSTPTVSGVYRVQLAALKTPLSETKSIELTNSLGISGLHTEYDKKRGLHKYYLPSIYESYEEAKSIINNVEGRINRLKPFVVKF